MVSRGLLLVGVIFTFVLAPSPAFALLQSGGATADGGGTFDTKNIETLINGFAWYGLAFAVTGIFVSASLWALGSKGQNPGQELTGKRGIMVCLAAAFIIGGLNPFMSALNGYAQEVQANSGSVTANGGGMDAAPTAGGLNQ